MFDLPDYIRLKKSSLAEDEERSAFWQAVFRGAPEPTDEDVVCTAWRLTRRIASVKGIIKYGELLQTATQLSPSPWKTPVKTFQGAEPANDHLLAAIQRVPMALQPPEERSERTAWLSQAFNLGLQMGFHWQPDLYAALRALTRLPESYWPSPATIMRWEEELVSESLDTVVTEGFSGAAGRLREKYKLSIPEAFELVNMAQVLAMPAVMAPEEVFRALQIMRLEKLAQKCALERDFRGELAALKEMSKLLGLHKKVLPKLEDDFLTRMEKAIEAQAIPIEEEEKENDNG